MIQRLVVLLDLREVVRYVALEIFEVNLLVPENLAVMVVVVRITDQRAGLRDEM
jgi:hypothetical protein